MGFCSVCGIPALLAFRVKLGTSNSLCLPASTTDGESDHEELFVNETMAELTKLNNLSVSAIDKFIDRFQKLKQKN
jgi:hypothetical protein